MSAMNLLRKLKPADYCTASSLLLILISFYFLIHGWYKPAIGSMLLAVLFDFIDGIIARRYGSSPYGKLLDAFFVPVP